MRNPPIPFLFTTRLCVLLLFLGAFTSDTPMSIYTVPKSPYSVSSSDIDLDGDQDILVGHMTGWQYTNPSVSVLANNAATFTVSDTSKSYCGYQYNIFACKIDNDEYPDLVTFYSDFSSGTAARYLRIWQNQDGSFNNFQDISLNSSAIFDYITYGDVNGDSLTDILVLSGMSHFWGVLYNLGNGMLSSPEYHYSSAVSLYRIACGDLNGDGRDDVVVSGSSVQVFYSFATGFQVETVFTDQYSDLLSVTDFDGDGDNDLVTVAGWIGNLTMYANQNDTALQAMPTITVPWSYDFSITDFNKDGLPDIALLTVFPDTSGTGLTDTVGGIKICYNQGNFQLSAPQFIRIINHDESGRSFHAADFDGNGYNDFVFTRGFGKPGNLEVLFNDGNGNFLGSPVGTVNLRDDSTCYMPTCFPNPFSETPRIRFELQKPAAVIIRITDQSGKEIIQMNEGIKLKGTYYADFGSTSLSPGTYYYSLILNGNLCASGKMIKF